jgi:hypothetical protein
MKLGYNTQTRTLDTVRTAADTSFNEMFKICINILDNDNSTVEQKNKARNSLLGVANKLDQDVLNEMEVA